MLLCVWFATSNTAHQADEATNHKEGILEHVEKYNSDESHTEELTSVEWEEVQKPIPDQDHKIGDTIPPENSETTQEADGVESQPESEGDSSHSDPSQKSEGEEGYVGDGKSSETLEEKQPDEQSESSNTENSTADESKVGLGLDSFRLLVVLRQLVESIIDDFGQDVEKPVEESKENITEVNETAVVEIENTTETLTEPEEIAEKIKNITEPVKNAKFQCTGRNVSENYTNVVQIVNNTGLLYSLNFEKNESGADCVLVLFYAPWCPFCAEAAPSFNALARAFPQLDILAVDAAHFSKYVTGIFKHQHTLYHCFHFCAINCSHKSISDRARKYLYKNYYSVALQLPLE